MSWIGYVIAAIVLIPLAICLLRHVVMLVAGLLVVFAVVSFCTQEVVAGIIMLVVAVVLCAFLPEEMFDLSDLWDWLY